MSGDVHTPQSLSLDLRNGFMYWVDRESNEPRIEQARLDGSERQVLFYSGTHRGISHAVSGMCHYIRAKFGNVSKDRRKQ